MTLAEFIIFILCIGGAIYCGRKGRQGLMIPLIGIAVVMFFLLAATILLVAGID